VVKPIYTMHRNVWGPLSNNESRDGLRKLSVALWSFK